MPYNLYLDVFLHPSKIFIFFNLFFQIRDFLNSMPVKIFRLFSCLLIFFKPTFSKNSFRNTIQVSNKLDPDQAQHYVEPDLWSNLFAKVMSK